MKITDFYILPIIFSMVATLGLNNQLEAQIDREFWFAPPEVSSGHGDRPIYLRISTMEKSANIRLLRPAVSQSPLFTTQINANTTRTIDLSQFINVLETNPPGQVLKTGILIVASEPVTAYYEVGSPWNSDIFILKGKNALGNRFVIPSQNRYSNGSYNPTPYSSFDIVATENNTVVNITPSQGIVGHKKDESFIVKLNKGETYSATNLSQSAAYNLGGSIVESNKPIAITLKEDSMSNGGCRDLLGDQHVPVKVTGEEYIIMKGFLTTEEWIFVTATEDSTKIFLDGHSSPDASLNTGEMASFRMAKSATYLRGTAPIYVLHITGFGCELGMAVLPSINCKGSTQIGFTRSTDEFFGMNLLVRKEGIGRFSLNGDKTLVPGSAFKSVPGTNDTWYAAQLSFQTSQIPVGQANLITNDNYSFQAGIVNGDASTTCRFGYFSAFSTLFIGDDIDMCPGQVKTLDAGTGKDSYLWSTGSTEQTIEISEPGTYWVMTSKDQCTLYDTLQVNWKQGVLNLGPDQAYCPGDTSDVDGHENFSWQWSNGQTGRYLETTEPGKYWLTIHNYTGCTATDTIEITLKEAPTVELGTDQIKCPEDTVFLDSFFPAATYHWQDGYVGPEYSALDSGLYHVMVSWNGCSAHDSVFIENLPGPPQEHIEGSATVCPFVEDVSYHTFQVPGDKFEWFIDGGVIRSFSDSLITVDWYNTKSDAVVNLLVTDSAGCTSDTISFAVRVNVQLAPNLPAGPDTLCLNHKDSIFYSTGLTNGSTYNWQIDDGEILSGQGQHGVLLNWQDIGQHFIYVEEESITPDTACSGVSEILEVFVFEDTTSIRISYVTVDTANDQGIHIHWNTNDISRIAGDTVRLMRRNGIYGNWQLRDIVNGQTRHFMDLDVNPKENTYQYFLDMTNLCGERVSSNIHQNLVLTGSSDTLTDVISLEWGAYTGWSPGVDKYEIWRKLDTAIHYTPFKTVNATTLSYSDTISGQGFEHHFRIRAIEKGGGHFSWSNDLSFQFTHPLPFIPNIVTPNGDTFNDFFYIKKIELYPNNHLTIFNRWGKVVYETKGYRNNWSGEDLSSGTYFYRLYLPRRNQSITGILSILR